MKSFKEAFATARKAGKKKLLCGKVKSTPQR